MHKIRRRVQHRRLDYLFSRQVHQVSSTTFQRRVLSNRILSISLDPSTKIQREHNGAVNSVDIDQAEGKYLLSGGGDGTVHLYDLEVSTRKERTIIASIAMTPRNYHGHVGGVSQVAWYPFDNGMFTTSSYDSTIKVWDSNSMQDACTFNLESKVYAHAMSSIATHGLIASATADPKIRLCDLRSGAFTHSLSAHRGTVLAVEWSPRHDYLLASGSTDSTMRLWDIRKSNSCLISFDFHNSGADRLADSNAAHTRAVNGVTFTPDGLHLVSNGLDDRIRLWSVVSGENTLVNFGSAFRNQFVHNVRPIITPLSAGPFHIFLPSDNHSILVYNLLDGTLVKTLSGAFGRINGLTWRPQSEDIYTAGNDHEILVWAPANTQIDEVQKALADQDAWSDSDGQD